MTIFNIHPVLLVLYLGSKYKVHVPTICIIGILKPYSRSLLTFNVRFDECRGNDDS